MIKAQDEALKTKHHARKVLKRATDGKCRICPQHDKTTDHLHFNLCTELGVKLDNEHMYRHVPRFGETSHEGQVSVS
jgi:transposase